MILGFVSSLGLNDVDDHFSILTQVYEQQALSTQVLSHTWAHIMLSIPVTKQLQ